MAAATVHQLKPKPSVARLRCTKCGAQVDAACNCGAPYEYIPPGKLAERAIADNPEKSDRAIAKELGINNATVSRARNRAGVANATPDKHVGQDGKSYPAKGKGKEAKPDDYEEPDDDEPEEQDEEQDEEEWSCSERVPFRVRPACAVHGTCR
jgi:hypothetical protein